MQRRKKVIKKKDSMGDYLPLETFTFSNNIIGDFIPDSIKTSLHILRIFLRNATRH